MGQLVTFLPLCRLWATDGQVLALPWFFNCLSAIRRQNEPLVRSCPLSATEMLVGALAEISGSHKRRGLIR